MTKKQTLKGEKVLQNLSNYLEELNNYVKIKGYDMFNAKNLNKDVKKWIGAFEERQSFHQKLIDKLHSFKVFTD